MSTFVSNDDLVSTSVAVPDVDVESQQNAIDMSQQPEVTFDTYTVTDEMKEAAKKKATKNIRATNVMDINLAEEELTSQGYFVDPTNGAEVKGELTHAVVTFLTPAFGQICDNGFYGLKIYSAHVNEENALQMANRLKSYHTELYGSPIYAILVMEMGKFVTIPHDKTSLQKLWSSKKESNEGLNELISNYRIEQEKGNILFNERKDTLIASAKKRNMSTLERARQLKEQEQEQEQKVDEITEFGVETE